jgi:hypothetical protein
VVGFEAGERGIEKFPARHDDDIDSGRQRLAAEQLTRPPLRPVPLDRGPELSGRGDPESRVVAAVRDDEHEHETALQPNTRVVGPLEFRPAANPGAASQCA